MRIRLGPVAVVSLVAFATLIASCGLRSIPASTFPGAGILGSEQVEVVGALEGIVVLGPDPLKRVLVEIIDPVTKNRIDAAVTSRRGKFSLAAKNQDHGEWLLRFSLIGFMNVEQRYRVEPDSDATIVIDMPLGL